MLTLKQKREYADAIIAKHDDRKKREKRTSRKRCQKCGFRIRGAVENHEKGEHHARGRKDA